ncbi:lectin subunit alpha-like [Lucilia sericata]|uniref:lectin subunit alpha-like n=1 Tax=Lucilia sericata TaxID=13632 RepID=UPI0018A86261|nr:lectin subunit alpha-like [Lucilia sericata]
MGNLWIYKIVGILLISKINEILATGEMYTSSNNNKYYIDGEQKYNWFEAVGICSSMNMKLVTIETKTKSDDINALVLKSFDKRISLWVGGIATRDNTNKLKYIWIYTGQPFSYVYWSPNNPDFKNNNEYCINIGSTDDMKWNDYPCTRTLGVICELQENNKIQINFNFYNK